MPFIVAPAADFDGSGQLTTLARALYRPTGALTGLLNETAWRAMALSAPSPAFTPLPAAVLRSALARTARVIACGHSLTDAWCYGNEWPGDWARILDSVQGAGFWETHFRKDTIPGSPIIWRWQQNTPSRADIGNYDVLVITEGGPPARPDVLGDRETLKDSVDYLFLFAENALVNGNGGAGAETILHTINTWTTGVDGAPGRPNWDMGFRASMVQYERNFRWLADYVSWKLREAHPELGPDYRIWIIPHHRLWIRIWDALQAGTMPDYTDLATLIPDGIHPLPDVGYGLACMTYAMVFQRNPAEIPYAPAGMSTELRDWLRQNAWEIVQEYRWAGMGGDDPGEPGFVPSVDVDPWGEPEPPEPGVLPEFVLSLTASSYEGPALTGLPTPVGGMFDLSAGPVTGALSLTGPRYFAAMLRKDGQEQIVIPLISTHAALTWWNGLNFTLQYNGYIGGGLVNRPSASDIFIGHLPDGEWRFIEVWNDGTEAGGASNMLGDTTDASAAIGSTTTLSFGSFDGATANMDLAGLWICDHMPDQAEREALYAHALTLIPT